MPEESIEIKKVRARLDKLFDLLAGRKTLLIVMQDFPDPDAIAAAAALRELVKAHQEITTTLACGGFVGRAENQALQKYLGLNIQSLRGVSFEQFDAIAMVDTQPQAGNNALPQQVVPTLVIDHHPMRVDSRKSPYYDVRKRYGATSTILFEYLIASDTPIPVPLATALLYGIRSDTADLGREAIQADVRAFLALYPVSNKRMLGRIAVARVPRSYFRTLSFALQHARSSGDCIYTSLGRVENPDSVAEIADLLLRDEETGWAMGIGYYGGQLLISLRTSVLNANAGRIMQHLVGKKGTGGGHTVMAGGQIALPDADDALIEKVSLRVINRLLKKLGSREQGSRLLLAPAP